MIENEFGAVSIDEALVKENLKVAEEVISLDNGCACCTVRPPPPTAASPPVSLAAQLPPF